jgi:hypothetical protein
MRRTYQTNYPKRSLTAAEAPWRFTSKVSRRWEDASCYDDICFSSSSSSTTPLTDTTCRSVTNAAASFPHSASRVSFRASAADNYGVNISTCHSAADNYCVNISTCHSAADNYCVNISTCRSAADSYCVNISTCRSAADNYCVNTRTCRSVMNAEAYCLSYNAAVSLFLCLLTY